MDYSLSIKIAFSGKALVFCICYVFLRKKK